MDMVMDVDMVTEHGHGHGHGHGYLQPSAICTEVTGSTLPPLPPAALLPPLLPPPLTLLTLPRRDEKVDGAGRAAGCVKMVCSAWRRL